MTSFTLYNCNFYRQQYLSPVEWPAIPDWMYNAGIAVESQRHDTVCRRHQQTPERHFAVPHTTEELVTWIALRHLPVNVVLILDSQYEEHGYGCVDGCQISDKYISVLVAHWRVRSDDGQHCQVQHQTETACNTQISDLILTTTITLSLTVYL